jgi:hypothetical protein
MKRLPRIRKQHLLRWLPLAWLVVMAMAFGYVILQQTIRAEANQPQTALVREAVNQLKNGIEPEQLISSPTRDLSQTLNSFVIVYSDTYKPLAGDVVLDNKLPIFPSGALGYAYASGENRVTWQPRDDIRIAAVVRSYQAGGKTGYVVAGRNLKEAESQITKLGMFIVAGGLAALLGSLGLVIITEEYLTV